jgi:hypothetical protein
VNGSGDGIGGRRGFVRGALIALALGLLLGRIGPFDTFSELSPAARYAYWVGLTLLMWLQVDAAALLLRHWPAAMRWPWPARAAAAGLLGALPAAFEVAWAESLLRVERDLGPVDLLAIYGDVALLAVPLALLLGLVRGGSAPVPVAPVAGEGPAGALLAKLAPARRGELLALASEDHYLRVYTARGDILVHHRACRSAPDAACMVPGHARLRCWRGGRDSRFCRRLAGPHRVFSRLPVRPGSRLLGNRLGWNTTLVEGCRGHGGPLLPAACRD